MHMSKVFMSTVCRINNKLKQWVIETVSRSRTRTLLSAQPKNFKPIRAVSITRLLIALFLLFSQAAFAAIDLVDDTGQKLSLLQAPRRIVTLAPHVTELVYAVGAGAQLVGVDSASDYPEQPQSLSRIGDFSRVNFERIAALRPDLIIAWASGNRAADIYKLRHMGIPVLLTEAHRLADVARLLRLIGRATAHQGRGEAAAQDFERKLRAIREQYAGEPSRRVFYQVWEKPLITLGGQHWISDAMALCGGRNIFSDLQATAPVVSVESVLARAPEMIVSGTDAPDARAAWQRFPQLPAVRRNAFIRMNADTLHRPTPRLLEGVATLCSAISRYEPSSQPSPRNGGR